MDFVAVVVHWFVLSRVSKIIQYAVPEDGGLEKSEHLRREWIVKKREKLPTTVKSMLLTEQAQKRVGIKVKLTLGLESVLGLLIFCRLQRISAQNFHLTAALGTCSLISQIHVYHSACCIPPWEADLHGSHQ